MGEYGKFVLETDIIITTLIFVISGKGEILLLSRKK